MVTAVQWKPPSSSSFSFGSMASAGFNDSAAMPRRASPRLATPLGFSGRGVYFDLRRSAR
jgi:hypothetical protein